MILETYLTKNKLARLVVPGGKPSDAIVSPTFKI